MPPHSFPNLEKQRYYQNGSRLNGVYSRDNLSEKVKDETYIKNLDAYIGVGTLGLLCMCWTIILLILTILEFMHSLRD